jgi:hypothetical protein
MSGRTNLINRIVWHVTPCALGASTMRFSSRILSILGRLYSRGGTAVYYSSRGRRPFMRNIEIILLFGVMRRRTDFGYLWGDCSLIFATPRLPFTMLDPSRHGNHVAVRSKLSGALR